MDPPSVQGTSQLSGQPTLLRYCATALLHTVAARVQIMGGLPLAGFNFLPGEGEYPNQTT